MFSFPAQLNTTRSELFPPFYLGKLLLDILWPIPYSYRILHGNWTEHVDKKKKKWDDTAEVNLTELQEKD